MEKKISLDYSQATQFSPEELQAYLLAVDSSIIVSITDVEGNLLFINKAFTRILGYTKEECIGRNYSLFNSGVHDKDFFSVMWNKILAKHVWHGDICNRSKFGEFIWLKSTIIPIEDENGQVEKFISVRQDISELKNQQEENWKQIQFLASVNKSSSNLIIRMDLDGVITYINNAFEKMLECENSDVVDNETPLQFIEHNDLVKKTEEINKQYSTDYVVGLDALVFRTSQGIKNEQEWQFVSRGGKIFTVFLCINYIYDQDQNPIGYVVVGIDLTQRKLYEESLIKSKIEAESNLKFKNEYLARLSHEFKTPLNGILGMVELLTGTDINSEQKDYLDVVQKSASRLLTLINKTLEFNKVENNEFQLYFKKFSISRMLIMLDQTYRSLIEGRRIQFKINNKLKQDEFLNDEKRIYQLLTYLIENSLKFTTSGMISLTIQQNEANELLFELRDTGLGISPDREAHLFYPFIYERPDSLDEYSGLGLSLAISKKIVEKLNGQIGYKTSLGHGSLFWFKIPLRDISEELMAKKIAGEEKISFGSLKALIVEDDPINQRLLKKILNKLEIYPEVVSNGFEALEFQAHHKFNLIFMDINMPIMNGFEATMKMRQDPFLYGNPFIVAVTANSVVGDQEDCLRAGMNDYIPKPIVRTTLEKVISKILTNEIDHEGPSKPEEKTLKFYMRRFTREFKGDEEIMTEFIKDFIEKVPNRIDNLENAIKEYRYKDIEIEAHNLKELVGNLYHEELRRILESVEQFGREKRGRNIYPLFVDLRTEMFNLIDELETIFVKKKVA